MKRERWKEGRRGEGKGKSIKSSNMNCAVKWLLKSHQESNWEVKCSGEPGRRHLCVLQQHWVNQWANFCSTRTEKPGTLQRHLCSHRKIFIPMIFMFVFLISSLSMFFLFEVSWLSSPTFRISQYSFIVPQWGNLFATADKGQNIAKNNNNSTKINNIRTIKKYKKKYKKRKKLKSDWELL